MKIITFICMILSPFIMAENSGFSYVKKQTVEDFLVDYCVDNRSWGKELYLTDITKYFTQQGEKPKNLRKAIIDALDMKEENIRFGVLYELSYNGLNDAYRDKKYQIELRRVDIRQARGKQSNSFNMVVVTEPGSDDEKESEDLAKFVTNSNITEVNRSDTVSSFEDVFGKKIEQDNYGEIECRVEREKNLQIILTEMTTVTAEIIEREKRLKDITKKEEALKKEYEQKKESLSKKRAVMETTIENLIKKRKGAEQEYNKYRPKTNKKHKKKSKNK